MQVTTDRQTFSGELIEVRSDGLLVLSEMKLRLLPYTQIVSAKARRADRDYAFAGKLQPNAETQERLRLVSRFPQSLPPDLLGRLLETYQQTEPAGVTP
jgi:hypothetical protein